MPKRKRPRQRGSTAKGRARKQINDSGSRSLPEVRRLRQSAHDSAAVCADCFLPLAPQQSVTIVEREIQTARSRSKYPKLMKAFTGKATKWIGGRSRSLTVPICLNCWLLALRKPAWSWEKRQRGEEVEPALLEYDKLRRLRCKGCGRPMRVLKAYSGVHLAERSFEKTPNKQAWNRLRVANDQWEFLTLKQSTCCKACHTKALKQRAKGYGRVQHDRIACEVCGKAFVPTKSTALTCSNTCRQKKFRRQQRAKDV